jgi:hypothetical protein
LLTNHYLLIIVARVPTKTQSVKSQILFINEQKEGNLFIYGQRWEICSSS